MGVLGLWRNLRRQQRYHGATAAAQLLALTIVRRAVVLERVHVVALDTTPEIGAEVPALAPGRDVRRATVDELVRLRRDPTFDLADLTPEEMARRIDAGHECIFNVVEGEIAGYAWMDPAWLSIGKVETAFELSPHEVHVYKGLTHPDHRGLRLGVDRYHYWQRRLPKLGKTKLVSDFSFDNPATMSRMRHLAMDRIGTVTLLELGSLHKLVCDGDLATRRRRRVSVDG